MRPDAAPAFDDEPDDRPSLHHAAERLAALVDDLPFVPETPYERRWVQVGWRGLLLVVLAVVVYLPGVGGTWLWQDANNITDDVTLRSTQGLAALWTGALHAPVAPLGRTLWWAELHLFGPTAARFRETSVALHAIMIVGLWLVLRRLSVPGAWLAAAVVAVHPVMLTSVAWPSRQPQVLGLAAAVWAAWAYLRARDVRPVLDEAVWTDPDFHGDDDAVARWPWAIYATAIVLALTSWPGAALAAAAAIPVCLRAGSVPRRWGDWTIAAVVATLAAAGHLALARATPLPVTPLPWRQAWLEPLLSGPATLWQVLVPTGMPFLTDRAAWLPLVPGLALLAAAGWGGVVWMSTSRRGGVDVAAALVGVIGVTQMTATFNRPTPAVAVAAIEPNALTATLIGVVVSLIVVWLSRLKGIPIRFWRGTIGMLLLSGFGTLTARSAATYAGPDSLWPDTISRDSDGVIARQAWAEMLVADGRAAEAGVVLDGAILPNRDADWLLLRGRVYVAQKQFDDALSCFKTAHKIVPNRVDALATLANVQMQTGHFDAAASSYVDLIAREPSNAGFQINAGLIQMELGHPDAAVEFYESALRIEPIAIAAHIDMANALFDLGRLPEAAEHLQRVIAIDPRNFVAYMNAGTILFRLHAPDKAERMFRAAVHLNPSSADAFDNLGAALMAENRIGEALYCFVNALNIDPHHRLATEHLAMARVAGHSDTTKAK